MRFKSLGAFGAFALIAVLMLSVSAASGAGGTSKQLYIVQMTEKPVAAYEGGTAGIPATKPARGENIDDDNENVKRYAAHLDSKHTNLVREVGAKKVYDYRFAYNGFAAELTEAQARLLESDAGVVSVEKAVDGHVDTSSTPTFMGLTGGTGAWSKLGGAGKAGEDVIIGIIDTGITPNHPSFSDNENFNGGANGTQGNNKASYYTAPPKAWRKGRCELGEGWIADYCNNKLIGARYFYAGFGLDRIAARDFLSPRDYNGHGSHTASTAGGNNGVVATGDAAAFGAISGMAPRARIAMYKVCWEDSGDGGCSSADSVAAIDTAVADGVDVLNYSISGTLTNYLDAVEVAFLFAADAGVFVATSAGNSGPGNFTVAHISPWLSAVAAGTHNRSGLGTVTVGPTTYNGRSVAANAVTGATVISTVSGLAGVPANDARLCALGSLDPAKVTGKIVFCDRGVVARIDKSLAVKQAGGIGMIMANTNVNSVNADLHFVPSIHVDNVNGDAIRAYLTANPGATSTISKGTVVYDLPAPFVAAFSSRGPSRASGEDIMKPDFMAPGEDILAAVAPEGNHGRSFDLLSGTSMSSPHVAGFGALLTHAHPDWSPAAMRSALATTADPVAGSATSAIFNTGSGHVNPTKSLDPGLVYDASFDDYRNFLKGQRLCNFCFGATPATAIDASDLNQPSIAIGGLAGAQTVTRTVTNVGSAAATYTATLTQPPGFSVVVSPSSFTIAPGATQTFTVAFTRTDAGFGSRRAGSLVWSDGTHSVRSPIIVSATAVAAPAQVTGTGVSGSASWTITTGFGGPLGYAKRGLIPAVMTPGNVLDDPTNSFVVGGPGITTHQFVVPAGTRYARFSLFDAFTDGLDDLDLYVHNSAGALVGASGGGTSAEEVNLVNPAADTYTVSVHGWQTDGPDANYTLFTWVLGGTDAGNTTVTGPATATIGGSANINLSWTGLTAGKKYLGQVAYFEGATERGSTVIRIDS
jgi:subtilisin family serine protease